MKRQRQQAGFSLMEVNIAVFVMAVGILSMVVLYPLGLRESTQGQADLKQAMFADFLLNQAVAAASQTNVPWTQWRAVPRSAENLLNSLPRFMTESMQLSGAGMLKEHEQFEITCCLMPGFSDKLMGILVQSTELEKVKGYNLYSNNPVFYAEVMFQGDPAK
jgi:hypothetical protein